MLDLDLLARASANEIILGKMGLFLLRFAIAAFVLFLIEETLIHFPYLQSYMSRPWGKLIVLLIVIGLAFVLCFYIPGLRVLHNVGLILHPKDKVWLDISLSALALSRSAWLWRLLIRRLEGAAGS